MKDASFGAAISPDFSSPAVFPSFTSPQACFWRPGKNAAAINKIQNTTGINLLFIMGLLSVPSQNLLRMW